MKPKQQFIDYHRELLGRDFDRFMEWYDRPLRKALRVCVNKLLVQDMKERLSDMGAKFEQIPWCAEGFWVDDRPWGATIEHQLGYFYVQEAASMLPAMVLDVKKEDMVLDMCAAPGSKSTQIAPFCNTLIANEPSNERVPVLSATLQRCGISNAVITRYRGEDFPDHKFDRILVDAPCSDVGVARKKERILKKWSVKGVLKIASLQKRILNRAFSLLKPGGTLVYSTCTTSVEENEEVILDLLSREPNARVVDTNAPVVCYHGMREGTERCLRIMPWHNDTETFFVAKIENAAK